MQIDYVKSHDGVFESWDDREKKFERLVWPITLAYMLCFATSAFLLLAWRQSGVEMTPHLAIATCALGVTGGLLLWGLRRISRSLRHD